MNILTWFMTERNGGKDFLLEMLYVMNMFFFAFNVKTEAAHFVYVILRVFRMDHLKRL